MDMAGGTTGREVIDVSWLHPRNAFSPMDVTVLGITTVVRAVLQKAWLPMLVTELGIYTLTNPVQSIKVFCPMVDTELGIMTDFNDVQLVNVLLSTFTDVGILTVSRLVQPKNVLFRALIWLDNVTSVNAVQP